MSDNYQQKIISSLLQQAGIMVNGKQPWDIQVHNPRLYARLIRNPSLGLGESYMDKWWDCQRIDSMIERILKAKLEDALSLNLLNRLQLLGHRLYNYQNHYRAKQVAKRHYDLGNDLFIAMLDKNLNYSCAYWQNAENLDQAQANKLDLICQKLMLAPGMRLLDVGCGWGAMAKHAAEHYGVSVVGITISKQQASLATQRCRGLPVTIRYQDYRHLNEKFERAVSIGMFEHVGHKNYQRYIDTIHRCLTDDGLFLLHTIGSNTTTYSGDPWTTKYIFPNGMLPSIKQISAVIENKFVMEDWHNLSVNYDQTLLAWHDNFIHAWPKLCQHYDERFYRMWNYYLLSAAGAFRARHNQLWQIVLSKNGVPNGYQSIR